MADWAAKVRRQDADSPLARWKKSGVSGTEIARRKADIDRAHREAMNAEGGFGTFAGDPAMEAFVKTARLESPEAVVLASDGLTDWLRTDPEIALRRARDAEPLVAPELVPGERDDLSVLRLGEA